MKNFKKFLLALPIMLSCLTGCQNDGEIINPTDFTKTFKKDCKDALGEVIPFCPCVTYEYDTDVDIYGDKTLDVYFSFLAEETCSKAYAYYGNLCEEAGYTVTAGTLSIDDYSYVEVLYADKVVKDNDAIELCIIESIKDDKPTLGVFGMTYLYVDENVYPQIAVDKVLGEDSDLLPKIEGDYTYSFYFDYQEMEDGTIYKALRVVTYGCYYDIEEWYFNELKEAGFVIYDDLTVDDPNSKPMSEYGEYTGNAFDAYYYSKRGSFVFGVYFTFNIYYNAFIVDIFTF